jgi:hypothetical protein
MHRRGEVDGDIGKGSARRQQSFGQEAGARSEFKHTAAWAACKPDDLFGKRVEKVGAPRTERHRFIGPLACVVHAAEVDGNGDVAGHRSVLAFVVTGSGDAVIRSDYQNDAVKNARFVTSWTLAAAPGTPINASDTP